MARSSKPTITATPSGYGYTPGDHHRYVWDGEGTTATVYRIVPREGRGLDLQDTGDRIPMEGVARTATAYMAAVDGWRAGGQSSTPEPAP